MATERLQSVAAHVAGTSVPHPFDPLSNEEIEAVVAIVRKEKGDVLFNAVSLKEPPKKEMMKWLEDPKNTPRPTRIADIVALGKGSKVYDGLVDLKAGKVIEWLLLEGVQPLVSRAQLLENVIG
jgi:primary-amine oxidase